LRTAVDVRLLLINKLCTSPVRSHTAFEVSGEAVDNVKVAGVNPNSFLQLLSIEKSNTVLLAVVLVLNVNLFFTSC
jgi:hypothetical protein